MGYLEGSIEVVGVNVEAAVHSGCTEVRRFGAANPSWQD